jgi:hypothetical protein
MILVEAVGLALAAPTFTVAVVMAVRDLRRDGEFQDVLAGHAAGKCACSKHWPGEERQP